MSDLPEKLRIGQTVKKNLLFMEVEGSLLCLWQPALDLISAY
jgi:hypothetical protein